MDNSISVQLYIFLTLLYDGLIIGVLFDIYKAFRYYIKPNKMKSFIGDLLFWIIVVAVTFNILMRSSFGELRGYIFIALFIGLFLYLITLSKIIYPIFIKIFKFLFLFLEKFYKILLLPFTLIKVMLKPFFNKLRKTKRASRSYFKEMKKYFKLISTKK